MLRDFPDFLQTFVSSLFRKSRQPLDDTIAFNAIENHLIPNRIVAEMSGELPERDSCTKSHADIITQDKPYCRHNRPIIVVMFIGSFGCAT